MEQLDNNLYMKLHHQIIHQLIRRERTQQTEDMQLHQEQQQQIPTNRNIRVFYTFESGPMLNFKQALDRLWQQHYQYRVSHKF